MQFSTISTLIKASAVATLLMAITTTEAAPRNHIVLEARGYGQATYQYYDHDNIYGSDGSHFKRYGDGFKFYTCDLPPNVNSTIGAAMSQTQEGISCNDQSIKYQTNTIYFEGW
jgi:hypothetical protein